LCFQRLTLHLSNTAIIGSDGLIQLCAVRTGKGGGALQQNRTIFEAPGRNIPGAFFFDPATILFRTPFIYNDTCLSSGANRQCV
jgi:hypothetical protein